MGDLTFSLKNVVQIIDAMAERSGFFYGIGPKQIAEIIAEHTDFSAELVEAAIVEHKLALHE